MLHSSELSWLLLCCSALLGQALGYAGSQRRGSVLVLLLTVTVPIWMTVLRALSLGPLLTLAGSALLATASYWGLAQLVPAYWRRREDLSVRDFYRIELTGALAGLVSALLLGPLRATQVFSWAALLGGWSTRGWGARTLLVLLALATSLGFPSACWRAAARSYPGHRLRSLEISPYQYVEVIEDRSGRFLLLNGLCHYGPREFGLLNLYLAQLPAEMLAPSARPYGCLVIGAGTLVAPALTAEQGLETTVIELDPAVVEVGAREFRKERPGDDRFQVETGDVRRLLARHSSFGLVVVNLPAPYSLNVASLFSREFLGELRQKLPEQGLCSTFLGSPLDAGGADSTQGPILAAMLSAFPYTIAVSGKNCENTVVIGSQQPVADLAQWRARLRSHGQNRFTLYSRDELSRLVQPFAPVALNDLRVCAAFNLSLWQDP